MARITLELGRRKIGHDGLAIKRERIKTPLRVHVCLHSTTNVRPPGIEPGYAASETTDDALETCYEWGCNGFVMVF
jgi:hypothetical protein